VPKATKGDIPQPEQARRMAELRRARYGSLLALPRRRLSAAGRTPSEIAAVLFCSRSRVPRVVQAYRAGRLPCADPAEEDASRIRLRILTPSLKRSVLALLKTMPRAGGGCRTRGSCATRALEGQARRGVQGAAETMRRWLHDLGWAWRRAELTAKGNDPPRVTNLARIRGVVESLPAGAPLCFADEVDLCLLPKVGSQWMKATKSRC
jgi:transposase